MDIGGSDSDEEDFEGKDNDLREVQALDWFNTATPANLVEVTGKLKLVVASVMLTAVVIPLSSMYARTSGHNRLSKAIRLCFPTTQRTYS